LGRTSPLVNERREWVPRARVVDQVRAAVTSHPHGAIDFISFVGSGEPTLHVGLGWMIRSVQSFTDIPIAVITNGSLLYLPEVRHDLATADVVMPTLVAADEDLYLRINRPHPELTLARLLKGLRAFRNEFHGRLWIEVMLIAGINDTAPALNTLAAAMTTIRPDQVHLTLPDRPPSEPTVQVPEADSLLRATAILGNVAQVVHPAGANFDLTGHATLADAIHAIVQRHPISAAQLTAALAHMPASQADAALAGLCSSGRLRTITRHGTQFWITADQQFAENSESHASTTQEFLP
jgi:wyosine [tRNA(Phe)-imidazoG37] synthetase (radical SAM superfamily)